ncbi:hypothetical protein FB451DRAFT_1538308 [Mycena latifolia]|nr:hypothetical protein FB451DRAFT_1538308 [Mycena latifolia]
MTTTNLGGGGGFLPPFLPAVTTFFGGLETQGHSSNPSSNAASESSPTYGTCEPVSFATDTLQFPVFQSSFDFISFALANVFSSPKILLFVAAEPSLPTSTNTQRTQQQISLADSNGFTERGAGDLVGKPKHIPAGTVVCQWTRVNRDSAGDSEPTSKLTEVSTIHTWGSVRSKYTSSALPTGAIIGLALSLTLIIGLSLFFAVRRCRWRQRHAAAEAHTVSPFMRLISPSDAARNDASRVRLQYLEKELRATQTKMQEVRDHSAQHQAPADVRLETETESEGMRNEMSLLRARIRELETQMRSAWAQGLSDYAPPGYTA